MSIFSQSRLAAILQDFVSSRREEVGLYTEIAEKLPLIGQQRILDVGTGSGLQLKVIHKMEPTIELCGLDLSNAAIVIAQKNLKGLGIDLRAGTIQSTTYEKNFFDIITCHSSMSNWDDLISCYNEIYRILKPGGRAIFFEPQKDIDIKKVVEIIKDNLANANPIRRFLAVNLNKFALQYGRRIGLNLYTVEEVKSLVQQSKFGESARIERATLQNLPIFMRITLTKPV